MSRREIGAGTKIWHFSHILPGANIGERCIFGQNCQVGEKVTIGNNVKVQNNVSIYTGTVIEDDVFLGPVVCTDQRDQSAIAGEPARALREDGDAAWGHGGRQRDHRVRHRAGPLLLHRRRRGGGAAVCPTMHSWWATLPGRTAG